MKAFLLYADRDLGAVQPSSDGTDLPADLELGALVRAMAGDDQDLHDVSRAVINASLATPEQIRYRQDILTDCLRHPAAVRAIHNLATDAIEAERQIGAASSQVPATRCTGPRKSWTCFCGICGNCGCLPTGTPRG